MSFRCFSILARSILPSRCTLVDGGTVDTVDSIVIIGSLIGFCEVYERSVALVACVFDE